MWGSEIFVFEILFCVAFGVIAVAIVVNLVKDTREWNQNNHSPRLTVSCRIVGKRVEVGYTQQPVGGDASGARGMQMISSTTHYVTFQVESGDRMEFCVDGREYGLLAEGDFGKLSFQGTRFLDFERG